MQNEAQGSSSLWSVQTCHSSDHCLHSPRQWRSPRPPCPAAARPTPGGHVPVQCAAASFLAGDTNTTYIEGGGRLKRGWAIEGMGVGGSGCCVPRHICLERRIAVGFDEFDTLRIARRTFLLNHCPNAIELGEKSRSILQHKGDTKPQ